MNVEPSPGERQTWTFGPAFRITEHGDREYNYTDNSLIEAMIPDCVLLSRRAYPEKKSGQESFKYHARLITFRDGEGAEYAIATDCTVYILNEDGKTIDSLPALN